MNRSREREITKSLEAASVRFVGILWCDDANIIRGKAVHLGMLSHYLEHGVGISAGQQGISVMYDAVCFEPTVVTSLFSCATSGMGSNEIFGISRRGKALIGAILMTLSN